MSEVWRRSFPLACHWDILRRDNLVYEWLQQVPYEHIAMGDTKAENIIITIKAEHYTNKQGDLKTQATVIVAREPMNYLADLPPLPDAMSEHQAVLQAEQERLRQSRSGA